MHSWRHQYSIVTSFTERKQNQWVTDSIFEDRIFNRYIWFIMSHKNRKIYVMSRRTVYALTRVYFFISPVAKQPSCAHKQFSTPIHIIFCIFYRQHSETRPLALRRLPTVLLRKNPVKQSAGSCNLSCELRYVFFFQQHIFMHSVPSGKISTIHCWPRVRPIFCFGHKLHFFCAAGIFLIWSVKC